MARKTTIKRSGGTIGSLKEKVAERTKDLKALQMMKELEQQKQSQLIVERPKPNLIISTTNKDFYSYDYRRKD